MSDPTMDRITAAVAAGRAGDRSAARTSLENEWESIGPCGDPLHRCTLAHYLADLMDNPAEELIWDVRALDAVAGLTAERAASYHPSLRPAGFRPSLYLGVADTLRRLGAFSAAAVHLEHARSSLPSLADDAYGASLRTICAEVGEAIENRSTVPRPTAP